MKLGLFFVISCTLLMAFKSVLIKLLMLQGFQTIEIMMLRNVITFSVVLLTFLVMYFNNKITVNSVKSVFYMLFVGLICFHISSFFDLVSLNYISVNLERLIVHLYPSMVCILLVLKNGKQAVNMNQWIAIGIIYCATILFVGFEQNSLFNWIGVLFALLAAFFYALYFVLIHSSIKKYGGTQATLFSLPLASLTINAQFWITDSQLDLNLLTTNNVILLLILGAIIGVGSMWLINQAMQRLGPSNTAIISSLGPFITAIIAYAFLGETLSVVQMLAMLIVVVAMYQLSRTKPKSK
ncbi:MAG: DMT family transporter [Saccharospirillaceae bacterium]|nr:DMT family transporter [Pseudomonadales bacterium]NRB78463.1 DMT family transporter [Saccharospirillaceae bacterium]